MSKQVRIPEDQHAECEKLAQSVSEAGLPFTVGKIVEMALNIGVPLLREDFKEADKILKRIKIGRPRK